MTLMNVDERLIASPPRAEPAEHVAVEPECDPLLGLGQIRHRPKLASYILPSERERFLEMFARRATFTAITERIAVCRDPRDDWFLELAAAGRAHSATPTSSRAAPSVGP